MSGRIWLIALVGVMSFTASASHAASGVLCSQIGYDIGEPMRAIVRSDDEHYLSSAAEFELLNCEGEQVIAGPVRMWGQKWKSWWWVADFSGVKAKGEYVLLVIDGQTEVARSNPIVLGRSVLWSNCFKTIAFDFLDTRAKQARTRKGWKDCGSDLQEFSSHVVAVDGLCDMIEMYADLTLNESHKLLKHIMNGSTYLADLQDKAEHLGLGRGAVLHEDRQDHVVTGNVAKGAMIFARASRLLKTSHRAESAEYLARAHVAFEWIAKHGPIVNEETQEFYPHVHGAPIGSRPPKDQWMTRDLVMMARAAVELYKAGRQEYKKIAVAYADRVMHRQVPRDQSKDDLYGHFYTYDDFTSFGGVRFTEKANIHCGAWSKQGRIYNKGGHYSHYLLPLIEMVDLWPEHARAEKWRQCLRNFAYGYFLPACQRSPFLILPAGYYRNEGLLYFSSWYHGHNNIYAFAASLALEFEKFFKDARFRQIAVGNLQWIAGLNCGITAGDPSSYVPVSMIWGFGRRYRGSWTQIPGSICNGFSASEQFRIAPPTAKADLPSYFDDEAYIAHSLPYLAAIARLEAYQKSDDNAR